MAALILALLLAQTAPAPAPRVEEGIRLVNEGDFEAAVGTLRAAAAAIAGDPTRSAERARAYLYLGVAHLALGQNDDAHRAFVSALRDDPRLRVTEDRFSPKVVAAFEAARRGELGASRAKGGRSTGRVVVAAAAGAAVAAGAAIALGGSSGPLRVVNARFATPTIECPDDSNARPIGFAVLVELANDGDAATILSVMTTATIVASQEPEVGFPSTRASTAAPDALPARRTTTVRVESTLLCSNAAGGPPRSNDWTARLIINTSGGTAAGQTNDNDRLRVEIP